MWPPPPANFVVPMHRFPPAGPPMFVHRPSHAPMLPHSTTYPHPAFRQERPPPWQPEPRNETWASRAGPAESWRPWPNHEITRQQYAQLPLSRPQSHAPPPQQHQRQQAAIAGGYEKTTAAAGEYAAQIDYEKQLRAQYEKRHDNYNDFSGTASSSAKSFAINAETSAKRIKLSWKLPILPGQNEKYKLRLVVKVEEFEGGIGRGARSGELGTMLDQLLAIHVPRTAFNAVPGSLYSIELTVIGQKNEVVAIAKRMERAMFSMDEIKVLMQKAINFTGTQMQPFTYIYRCKPKIYWDYIYNDCGQIMQPYEKDSNGQAASPINQNIKGLFFSARTNPDGSLPNSSPFGDVRMVLPAMTLLDPRHVNLYFSDFYCNRVTHYVTVVVAIKDSAIDSFCREKLLPLQAFENPFLLFQVSTNPEFPILYSVNKKIWVEIYYTEDVPMRWGRFDNIIPQGAGTSKIGGLPHNKSCRICNLYPAGMQPALPPPDDFERIPEEKAEAMVNEAITADFMDLVDSEESCSSAGDAQEQDENSQFATYGELKNRLEQLDHSIPKGNPSNPFEKLMKECAFKIRHFMDGMKSDFTSLDARIAHLETADLFSQQAKEQRRMFARTVDALIDETTNLAEKRGVNLENSGDERLHDKRFRRDSM